MIVKLLLANLMMFVPHRHWWRYYWDREFAAPGQEDRCRECRLCWTNEFTGEYRELDR